MLEEFTPNLEAQVLSLCPVPIMGINDDLGIIYANVAAVDLFAINLGTGAPPNLLKFLPGLRDLDIVAFGNPDGYRLLHKASKDHSQVEACNRFGKFQVEVEIKTVPWKKKRLTIVALHDMTALNGSMKNILKAHQELAEFNRVAIGREIRMVGLKQEVNELLVDSGIPIRYTIDE